MNELSLKDKQQYAELIQSMSIDVINKKMSFNIYITLLDEFVEDIKKKELLVEEK